MRYTVRPISDRSAFTGHHDPSPFRATWSDTLQLLGRELEALGADECVIEVDVAEGQIRLDGMLRSDAKVTSPAVRVAFDSRYGSLTYATDRYQGRYYGDPEDWKHNVRAIALGLEALRKVDRYGITKRGEQYAGWKQIEAGPHGTGPVAAVLLLTHLTGQEWPTSTEQRQKLFRAARAAAHPDRHGGDRTLWDQVESAGHLLGVAS